MHNCLNTGFLIKLKIYYEKFHLNNYALDNLLKKVQINGNGMNVNQVLGLAKIKWEVLFLSII